MMPKYLKYTLILTTFLSSIALFGSAFFYLWELGDLQIALTTVLAILLSLLITTKIDFESVTPTQDKTYKLQATSYKLTKISHYSLVTLYVLATIKTLIWLSTYQMAEAIQGPWQVVPSNIFIIYFILTLLLALIIIKSSSYKLRAYPVGVPMESGRLYGVTSYGLLLSFHFFLTYSIALLVYATNFGFDPFIHQATEKILSLTGTISPKPLLYIGQYSLVIWFTKVFGLGLATVDKLLVPVMASLLLPPTIYFSLTKGFKLPSATSLLTLLVFPIFLLPFFFTVPQNLATLFLLIAILVSIICHAELVSASRSRIKSGMTLILWLLGFATFFIHPFSGVPLLIYLAIFTWLTQKKISFNKRQKLIGVVVLTILGIAALPLAFGIGGQLSNQADISVTSYQPAPGDPDFTSGNSSGLQVTGYSFASWLPFYSVFHLVYLFEINHTIILALLAAAGLWMLLKNKKNNLQVTSLPRGNETILQSYKLLVTPLLSTFLIISISVSILSLLNLPIISYEIPEFIARFWQIAQLFLIPIILYGIGRIIDIFNIPPSPPFAKEGIKGGLFSRVSPRTISLASLLFFIPLFTTISLYLTYPRVDAFAKSRAFATSQHDISAVHWIENNATGSDYVVLANQAVSAAALQEFGFKKYYNTCLPEPVEGRTTNNCQQLFYYPIPTTSPLYELYLGMVYDTLTKTRLQQALDITGAKLAYFVINDYWLDYDKIVEEAKEEFNEWKIIGDGSIYVFRYSN